MRIGMQHSRKLWGIGHIPQEHDLQHVVIREQLLPEAIDPQIRSEVCELRPVVMVVSVGWVPRRIRLGSVSSTRQTALGSQMATLSSVK
jgi:hypothetical protein